MGMVSTRTGEPIKLVTGKGRPASATTSIASPPEVRAPKLSDLESATPALVSALVSGGFTTPTAIAEADLEELLEIKGVGKATAKKLVDEARKLLR